LETCRPAQRSSDSPFCSDWKRGWERKPTPTRLKRLDEGLVDLGEARVKETKVASLVDSSSRTGSRSDKFQEVLE